MPRSAAPSSQARATASATVKSRSRRSRIKFGAITVLAPKPSSSQVKRHVAASSLALERAAKRLIKPGVRLNAKKGVPQYAADPDRPGVYIRVLNGKTDFGRLVDGVYQVIE